MHCENVNEIEPEFTFSLIALNPLTSQISLRLANLFSQNVQFLSDAAVNCVHSIDMKD